MILAVVLTAIAVLTVGPAIVWVQASKRFDDDDGPRRDFCEVCDEEPPTVFVLTSTFDDATEREGDGSSLLSATYCAEHAPEGATERGNPRR